ncbi:hypothetical protein [Pseudoalteromonas maricaloris]|uniref:hypothetical protein n=1 Tax=Pseudoalteromonas maricaloris TaxID=184924 RepID=UPI00068DFC6C|nr:hypothetical protein [Pseudoalteromonas flavipulchra]MBD0781303.1 hypothetical protein [Pseudoalteromonas flavipulchra]MBE0372811.1 hypothetical protein [Pseudoalteromonas flavipulchra NCIMB 2033 = ATCC BAA-314]
MRLDFKYNYYLNINTFERYEARAGVSFTADMIGGKYSKRFNKPHRFKSYGGDSSVVRIFLLSPFLFSTSCMLINILVLIECLFTGKPWLEYLQVIAWLLLINFALVNIMPYLSSFMIGKYVYFDREKQKVSFTFDIPNCTERDEFGHCCFDYSEVKLDIKHVFTDQTGAMTYVPIICHKDSYKYPKAKVTTIVNENARSTMECDILYEDIRRFMDKSKPLPESPEYEGFRHLDPVTAEHDKAIGRPASYWSEMSLTQQIEIGNKLFEPILELNELHPTEPLPELSEPWNYWKPDGKKREKAGIKREFMLIAMQLLTSKPM